MINLIGGVRFSLSYEGQKRTERSDSQGVSSVQTTSPSLLQDIELDTVSRVPEPIDIFGMETPSESFSTSPDSPSLDPQSTLISKLVNILFYFNIRLIRLLLSIFLSTQSYMTRRKSVMLYSFQFMFLLQIVPGC